MFEEKMTHTRGFRGIWIPAEIWLNKEMSLIEKALLVEIDSLDNAEGCHAKNSWFAERFNCTAKTISRGISKLKEMGFVKEVTFTGRNRILRVQAAWTNCPGSMDKKSKQPRQNVQALYISNTVSNTMREEESLPPGHGDDFQSIDDLRITLKNKGDWKQHLRRNLNASSEIKFDDDQIEKMIDVFLDQVHADGVTQKHVKDAMQHCSRWLLLHLKSVAEKISKVEQQKEMKWR